MARGVLMHRLLQSLPDIPRRARAEAARRHLARAARDFGAEEQQSLLGQVQRVLEDARFSELFLPGSRAEVPIVGRLKGGAFAVSGQVDRLAVTDDAVLIADYKTNRPAPQAIRGRAAGLHSPTGAVSRRARPALSGQDYSRRPALDRCP